MPMETLAGSGEALRAESFSMGVNIDPHSRMLFGSYLQNDVGLSKLPRGVTGVTPATRLICLKFYR
jgi:hypothetical protein